MVVYINSIKFNRSLVDGPGVRTVIFFQGCDLHCNGCQNPSTWEMKNGTEMTTDELVTVLKKEVVNKKVTFSVCHHYRNSMLNQSMSKYKSLINNEDIFSQFTNLDIINSIISKQGELTTWLEWYKSVYCI